MKREEKGIELRGLTKTQAEDPIVCDISLKIPAGKFFALLGPSGCGKTTLLRLIAGLDTADSGSIFLDGEDITNLPIHRRPINIVFQNYALFPHLDVFDNVAYSLYIKKMPKHFIKQKVLRILASFGLENHVYKSVTRLSGGQQQRVALARAIVNEPAVLLLDEPLAALDFTLRERMLLELIELQDTLKTTFLYVTHDQFEALTVADQMAIMNHQGTIEQIGTPKEIYEFPASSFVAKFVGSTNILQGILCDLYTAPYINVPDLGSFTLFLPQTKEWMQEKKEALLSIRPEKLFISKTRLLQFTHYIKGSVEAILYHGRATQYSVLLSNQLVFQVFEQNEEHFPEEDIDYGDEVYLHWQKESAVLLER